MSGNALIPLMGEPMSLARNVAAGAIAGNQLLQLSEDRKNAPLMRQAAQMEVEAGKITLSKEKAIEQLRNAAIDGSYIRRDLASGDLNTAISRMEQRNRRIMESGGDNQHTQQWLSALSSRDPAQIQAVAAEMEEIERAYQTYGGGGGTQATPSFGQPVEVVGPDGKRAYVQVDKSGKVAPMTGYSPPPDATSAPTYSQPVEVMGPDGRPTLVRFDNRGGAMPVQGYSPAPKSGGMSMTTNPDGTVTWAMGGAGGGSVSSSTNSKIEQSILANDQSMQYLGEIESRFKPEYLTVAGKIGATLANWKDKLGQLDPNSQEAATLKDYAAFAASTGELFAKTLKEMSGGAVTPQESTRQEVWIPNAETDGPEQFKSKMDRSIKFIRSANARLHYARANGLTQDQMYGIPLDSIRSVINARAEELESSGLSDEQISAQLSSEFGL